MERLRTDSSGTEIIEKINQIVDWITRNEEFELNKLKSEWNTMVAQQKMREKMSDLFMEHDVYGKNRK